MSDENEVVQQDEAENALEPAQAKAEETVAQTETPDPAQEKAEAEARAAKREARRERKDYYELKAKAEYLERELRRRELSGNQEQQNDDVDDIDVRVERKIAEIRAKDSFSCAYLRAERFSMSMVAIVLVIILSPYVICVVDPATCYIPHLSCRNGRQFRQILCFRPAHQPTPLALMVTLTWRDLFIFLGRFTVMR